MKIHLHKVRQTELRCVDISVISIHYISQG